VRDLNLEVQFLVHQIHWVIWEAFFIKFLITILIARNDIDMDLSINFMISGHNWNNSRIIHHVPKSFKHVKGLSQQNRLLLLKEWV